MYALIRTLLFLLPPEMAHDLSLTILNYLPRCFFKKKVRKPFELWGLHFPNRVGLAAGLDNNGDYIPALDKLGFGFIELGGVTPKPQRGNPKPRLFRLKRDKALINRMGFHNKGVDYLVHKLKTSQFDGVLGVNIAKNKDTPNEKAVDDYLYCMTRIYPFVSYITVNVSSPNTPGLRQLQHGELLVALFKRLKSEQQRLTAETKKYVPMLVKLAPDLSDEELIQTATLLEEVGIDGFVFTNTSLSREGLSDKALSSEAGGLSGAPLFEKATSKLMLLSSKTSLPIIGLGGIMSVENAKEKKAKGASLVQLYSGLIYQGPGLINAIAKAL